MTVDEFIAKWENCSGKERSTYGPFLTELCNALGVEAPGPSNDYHIDASVPGGAAAGGTGFIDLYKRSHFILEAKQSKICEVPTLPGFERTPPDPSPKYDELMRSAFRQARRYAQSLPEPPWPPFIIVLAFSRRVIERHLVPLPAREGLGVGSERSEPVEGAKEGNDPASSRAIAQPTPDPSLAGRGGLHLVLACPDHPWTKATRDAAAVRIAMTVAEGGPGEGRLIEVEDEAALDTDTPELRFSDACGIINADLTVGADVSATSALTANCGISYNGMMLAGQGFKIDEAAAKGIPRRS